MTGELRQFVDDARRQVGQVSSRLLAPSVPALDECGQALERALVSLVQVQTRLDSARDAPAAELPSGLIRLAQEIRHARILLAAAGELYFGSLQPLLAAAGLYNAQGGPQPVTGAGRLSITG